MAEVWAELEGLVPGAGATRLRWHLVNGPLRLKINGVKVVVEFVGSPPDGPSTGIVDAPPAPPVVVGPEDMGGWDG